MMDRFVEAGGNFIDTADTYWVRFRILESIERNYFLFRMETLRE